MIKKNLDDVSVNYKDFTVLTNIALLFFFISFSSNSVFGQDCNCTEYVYLNEVGSSGEVHKFEVTEDNPLNIEIGTPWSTDAGSDPHGLAGDENGFLYIAEGPKGPIRRLTCSGVLVSEGDFIIEYPDLQGIRAFNISSIGNTLYVLFTYLDVAANNELTGEIHAYDLCTGASLDILALDGAQGASSWGFYIDPRTDTMYATNRNGAVFILTEDDFNSSSITPAFTVPVFGQRGINGIVTDELGNIYIAHTGLPSTLRKYNSSGVLLGESAEDDMEDGSGYALILGLVYSKTNGRIYSSNFTPDDECVSVFDTDLNYLGAAVPPTGGVANGKGIATFVECCPDPEVEVVNTTLCASIGTEVFLQDFLNCSEGVVCESIWIPGDDLFGMTFNDCNLTVTIDSNQACGSFTLTSPESLGNSQCGSFTSSLNLQIIALLTNEISGDQDLCAGQVAALLTSNVTSNNGSISYQWQQSIESCFGGFTDIDGATEPTYEPGVPTNTTYFRLMSTIEGINCVEGNCTTPSNCVIIDVSYFCVPALSEWGMLLLILVIIILGVISVKQIARYKLS